MALPEGWQLEEEVAAPEGWQLEGEDGLEGAPPAGKPEVGTGESFVLNALDSASLVGVPRALAFGDTVKDTFAGRSKLGDFNERYHKNLDHLKPVKEGMDQTFVDHPVAAIAGQLAPALLTPSGAGKGMATLGTKRAAIQGGLHGLIGGNADTSGGDIKGTVIDTALGAAGGAGGELLGSATGKLTKYIGEKAGAKLEGGIMERVRSLLGKYGQKKKDAVAAMKNLKIQDALERAPKVGNAAASPAGQQLNRLKSRFPNAEADLYDASKSNAGKQIRRFVGSQNRFGPGAMPDVPYARRLAVRNMSSQKLNAIKDLLGVGAQVGVGMAAGKTVAEMAGAPSGSGAAYGSALIGGAGGLYVARKLATNVMTHPKVLSAMSRRLPELGRKLENAGGRGGAAVGYLTALLASPKGQQALDEAAVEVAEADGLIDPISAEDGGSDGWHEEKVPAEDAEPKEPKRQEDRKLKKGVRLIPSSDVRQYPKPPSGGAL